MTMRKRVMGMYVWVVIIHIMVLFHSSTFFESNSERTLEKSQAISTDVGTRPLRLAPNNYKMHFYSNIQIITFLNTSNHEDSFLEDHSIKIVNQIKTLFNMKFTNHGRIRNQCVVFIIHIMNVLHS